VAVALGLSPDTYASILGQLNALRDGAAEARRTALDMDMMSVVGQLAAVVARSQQALRVSVELVRQQGASWTEVAALFGTSRQNAQQRFGAVAQRNAVDHAQLSLDDLLRAP
jgi:flavin-binding protein dodecin